MAAAVRAGRAQFGDRADLKAGWEQELLVCPAGCRDEKSGGSAAFTWAHVQFMCKCTEVVEAREEWVELLGEGITCLGMDPTGPLDQLTELRFFAEAGCSRPLVTPVGWKRLGVGSELVLGTEVERRLRRAVGALIRKQARAGAQEVDGVRARGVCLGGA